MELRETCQNAGISVKASTDAGRDSIFRTAVIAAISESQSSQDPRLANMKPHHFVAGVSKDLGAHHLHFGLPQAWVDGGVTYAKQGFSHAYQGGQQAPQQNDPSIVAVPYFA